MQLSPIFSIAGGLCNPICCLEFSAGKELIIHSPPHIHEEAFCTIKKHLAPGSQVVDLGAGSVAFTKRLADAGMVVEFGIPEWFV